MVRVAVYVAGNLVPWLGCAGVGLAIVPARKPATGLRIGLAACVGLAALLAIGSVATLLAVAPLIVMGLFVGCGLALLTWRVVSAYDRCLVGSGRSGRPSPSAPSS